MLESSFDRTMHNIKKAGAYYTDLEHCGRIATMFQWPDDEVSILEPSAGDGTAVLEATKNCSKRKIFAVELDREVVESKLQKSKEICESLCCDFLETKISNKAFSFCFSNPPYIAEVEGGRMEIAFLKRIIKYLSDEGILVYVVNISTARTPEYLELFFSNFELLHMYRFSEEEYMKYKQVVMIGRKREEKECSDEEMVRKYSLLKKEEIPELPKSFDGDLIEVPPSPEKRVKFFTSKIFDEVSAQKVYDVRQPQKVNMGELLVEPFDESEVGETPTMPNSNTLYLLSTLGCGMGKTGCKENKDEHLQRGCASIEEHTYQEVNDSGETEEITRKSTKITVTILEQNGKFTTLE